MFFLMEEVALTKYRGALGSLCQIGTCLGIITSLILGIPSRMIYTGTLRDFDPAILVRFRISVSFVTLLFNNSSAKHISKRDKGSLASPVTALMEPNTLVEDKKFKSKPVPVFCYFRLDFNDVEPAAKAQSLVLQHYKELRENIVWWRTMLYIASIPGILVAIGMQFTVDSPRWLCKAGRINDAKTVICELWGASEVDSAIEEFQSVSKDDSGDSDSRWSEILEKPHSRGCVKVVLAVTIR
ncbi:hypothetical protein ACSQ67_025566 [Phaseolus vulgaris]